VANLAETNLIPKEKKREVIINEMEIMLKREDIKLQNFWCTLEPNTLDGMDAHFINRNGSDANGVFSSWFINDSLTISDTEKDYHADYYMLPKTKMCEVVCEPYWDTINGENLMMISYVIPISLNDRFIGVLGTDFYIRDLIDLVDENRQIIGVGKLVTDKGIIVSHINSELIGGFDKYDYQEIKDKMSQGKTFEGIYYIDGKKTYKVYVPVYFGRNNEPWFYIVEVPAWKVYSDTIINISMVTVILLLLVVSIYYYSKTLQQNHKLKFLHRGKDKLFSVLAHDLRLPIATLSSLLQIDDESILDDENRIKLLKSISGSVEEIYTMLENLLHWAKSQMSGMKPEPVFFDVQERSFAVTDALLVFSTRKNIELNNCIEKHQVYADCNIFDVVIRNLTMNAIKYTGAVGKITLSSEVSGNMLIISVVDTGIGIPCDIQGSLFNFMETQSRQGTDNEKGTGLGLVLCADFVKASGGSIRFSSKEGEGSTFSFSLPARRIDEDLP
jgi:signal transduction histidine kinase